MNNQDHLPRRMPEGYLEIMEVAFEYKDGLSLEDRRKLADIIVGEGQEVRNANTIPAPPSGVLSKDAWDQLLQPDKKA